jgi:hypothetical protein
MAATVVLQKKKLPLSKNHNRGARIFISTPKFSGKYVCCP